MPPSNLFLIPPSALNFSPNRLCSQFDAQGCGHSRCQEETYLSPAGEAVQLQAVSHQRIALKWSSCQFQVGATVVQSTPLAYFWLMVRNGRKLPPVRARPF